ncbi:MAG: hypothetical protein DRI57_31215 [Deltaproteobacteria bacterium]|nr:MAG: hypothetical protein DRI57_31215 [Deltaproteobacteria bacterium]
MYFFHRPISFACCIRPPRFHIRPSPFQRISCGNLEGLFILIITDSGEAPAPALRQIRPNVQV